MRKIHRDQRAVLFALLEAESPLELASAIGRGTRLAGHLKGEAWASAFVASLDRAATEARRKLSQWGDDGTSEVLWGLDDDADELGDREFCCIKLYISNACP